MKSCIAILLCTALPLFAGDARSFRVEVSKQIQFADQAVIFEKVASPVLVQRPSGAPSAVEQTYTLEDLGREAKTWRSLDVTATVYPTTPVLTELRVRTEEKEYLCISNVDFRDLSQISQFEDEHNVYAWFPIVSEGDPAEMKKFPAGLGTSAPDFVVISGTHDKQALQGLDVVHAYYRLNKAALVTQRIARERERAAWENELREQPSSKQTITFRFWEMQAGK